MGTKLRQGATPSSDREGVRNWMGVRQKEQLTEFTAQRANHGRADTFHPSRRAEKHIFQPSLSVSCYSFVDFVMKFTVGIQAAKCLLVKLADNY